MNGMITHLRSAIEKRRAYNSIVFELSTLSDRELADLGMNRFSARNVAREHVYGK
jgi:uncharacterized protein YjiS (DUF1127 family)